jgi:hypothetical protein
MSKVVKESKRLTPVKAPVSPKSHGLPIVSDNIIDAIHDVYAGKRWGEQLTAARDRLIQENPHLVKFIESQISKYPRSVHPALFEVVIGTLTVLEHQALVDAKVSRSRS